MFRVLRLNSKVFQVRAFSNSHAGKSPAAAQLASHALTPDVAEYPGVSNYRQMYKDSIQDPSGFWTKVASELHFEKVSGNGLEYNFDPRKGDVFIKFMENSITNVAYNCLEQNIISGKGNKIAFHWEGNSVGDESSLTYSELKRKSVEMARVLKRKGVKKGDVVAIYLPMIVELPVAMLACARIGAIHSVIFAGFSSTALADRMKQSNAKVLITCDGFFRGEKHIALKNIADEAVANCAENNHPVNSVICLEHLNRVTTPKGAKIVDTLIKDEEKWQHAVADADSTRAPVEWCDAEDPLFVLYTSGSTGKPKGIVHSTAGYMTSAYSSTKLTFDVDADKDVYWSMADHGWITGHTYGVYGPLLNGMTSVLFEGVPSYPDYSRTWKIVEKYNVSKLYTSPTAIRSMMAHPDHLVTEYDRSKLKVVGTVGEPMNPCAWNWVNEVVGEGKCSIVDTYWQTETGCHLLTAHHEVVPHHATSGKIPFLGITPQILDENGKKIHSNTAHGTLVVDRAWPGMMRTIYGDHERFINTYFVQYPGYYFTGDAAKREDEHYWVTGRVDDLMNVSGHLLSTAEIESVMATHPNVVEAAVVAIDHPIKGQVPYAFATIPADRKMNKQMVEEIRTLIRKRIGAIAVPDVIQLVSGLPKTRSGKIVRRILRKIAEGKKHVDLGDVTTLADDTIIEELWNSRAKSQK